MHDSTAQGDLAMAQWRGEVARTQRSRLSPIVIAVAMLGGLFGTTPLPAEAVVVAAPPTIIAGWGDDFDGQLGDATYLWGDAPVPVAALGTGALSGKVPSTIASGDYHECAIADGRPYCWGWGSYGQLGNNTFDWRTSVPVAVDTSGVLAGKTLTAITAGYAHTCAIADGKPYCWGYNNYGQLGDGTTDDSSVPVAVDTTGVLAGKTVTAINAGYSAVTCAIADGAAYCWGSPSGMSAESHVPVAVDTSGVLAGKTITAIQTQGVVTCVIADAAAYCWGINDHGQLGDGTTDNSDVPVAVDTSGVLAGRTVTAITGGFLHTCAIADGRAFCWGDSSEGQLGTGLLTDSLVPVAVDTSGVLAGKTLTAMESGRSHTCVLSGGKPYCWSNNDNGQLGNNDLPVDALSPEAVITSGVLSGKVAVEVDAGAVYSAALAMPDPGFCDVPTTSPFFSDVVWLSAVGVTSGFADGCFHNAASVSRQAMAAFLFRALEPTLPEPTCTGGTRMFSDVPATSAFCGHIEWLATSGITTGFVDGTFKPFGTVSRQAMAAFLHRGLYPGVVDPTCTGPDRMFSDVPATSAFCGSIEWLATSGVTTGFPDGTFHPGDTVSRQAMAAFLHRAFT